MRQPVCFLDETQGRAPVWQAKAAQSFPQAPDNGGARYGEQDPVQPDGQNCNQSKSAAVINRLATALARATMRARWR